MCKESKQLSRSQASTDLSVGFYVGVNDLILVKILLKKKSMPAEIKTETPNQGCKQVYIFGYKGLPNKLSDGTPLNLI